MAVVDKPWDGSPERFSDEQYQSACALDRKSCGGDWADKPPKTRCSLPYKEPNGDINKNGVHAAAGRIGQVTGACEGAISSAKAKLRGAYKTIGEPVPDSLKEDSKKSTPLTEVELFEHDFGVEPGVPRHGVGGIRGLIPFEVREAPAGEDGYLGILHGHFAVFNRWTEIDSFWEGRFMEQIAPGAFKKTFSENQSGMRCLLQHGRDPQIGMKPLGPINELREDDFGALYEVPLIDTSYNRDIYAGLKEGLYGASFRFQVIREEVNTKPGRSEHNPDGIEERTIVEAKVREFGPVTFPAYEAATAGVRSLVNELVSGDMEIFLELARSQRFRDRLPDLHSDAGSADDATRLNGNVDTETTSEEVTAPSEGAPERTETETQRSRPKHLPARSTRLPSAARPLRTSVGEEDPPWKL